MTRLYGSETTFFQLADVAARAARNPRFVIPSIEERMSLVEGNLVVLVFSDQRPTQQPVAERLRCEVVDRIGEDYIARLLDQPRYIEQVSIGDEITFRAQHIAAITRPL